MTRIVAVVLFVVSFANAKPLAQTTLECMRSFSVAQKVVECIERNLQISGDGIADVKFYQGYKEVMSGIKCGKDLQNLSGANASCLSRQHEIYGIILNQKHKAALDMMDNMIKNATFPPHLSKKDFIEAQNIWHEFKNLHCMLHFSKGAGIMFDEERCKLSMTLERLRYIEDEILSQNPSKRGKKGK